VEVQFMAY